MLSPTSLSRATLRGFAGKLSFGAYAAVLRLPQRRGGVGGGGGAVLDVFHILVRKDVTKEFVVVDLNS